MCTCCCCFFFFHCCTFVSFIALFSLIWTILRKNLHLFIRLFVAEINTFLHIWNNKYIHIYIYVSSLWIAPCSAAINLFNRNRTFPKHSIQYTYTFSPMALSIGNGNLMLKIEAKINATNTSAHCAHTHLSPNIGQFFFGGAKRHHLRASVCVCVCICYAVLWIKMQSTVPIGTTLISTLKWVLSFRQCWLHIYISFFSVVIIIIFFCFSKMHHIYRLLTKDTVIVYFMVTIFTFIGWENVLTELVQCMGELQLL